MKIKLLVITLLITLSFASSAQDTVRYGDPWYMFNPKPALFDDAAYSNNAGAFHINNSIANYCYSEIIQIYPLENDTVTVYGIAVTLADSLGNGMKPNEIVLYRLVEDDSLPTLEAVDSVDSLTFLEYGRTCYFEYQFDTPTPHTRRSISCEYYFAHPQQTSLPTMTDTLCVGIYHSDAASNYVSTNIHNMQRKELIYDYGVHLIEGVSKPEGNWLFGWNGETYRGGNPHYQQNLTGRQQATFALWRYAMGMAKFDGWGLMFPIIGLRCVKPYLWVEERGSTEARVRWTQAEAGIEYEVAWGRYGAEPDSCPSVLLTDTTFALTGLEPGSRNAVWVRKACHYATPGYDTVVWSEWSRPTVFLTLGVGEAEEAGVSVTARRGAVEVSCAEADAAVQVYDMAGRLMVAARTKADSPLLLPVPAAGVYTVRVGSGPAHKVVVF